MQLAYRLIFLRHGETDWNAAGRLQGQRDTPLNARGRAQAGAAAGICAAALPESADRHPPQLAMVASPLLRACATMAIVREGLGLPQAPFATDDRLKEIAFGDWEGMTWAEITRRFPAAAAAREQDRWGFAPPGGESYAEVAARVTTWLETLDGDTLVVAHGGIGRVLLVLLAGMDPVSATHADIYQGRALDFQSGSGTWLG
ncbi:MAG: phosphoglycerate mutase family protein [Hyphomicrobiales bacterium]|nr:phosphoglycerate mutase family protein [Hyphomicrobiales bacterium]